MPDRPAGYCVCYVYGPDVSQTFFEDYDDAVEELRKLVLAFSKLPVRTVQKMNADQLNDAMSKVSEGNDNFIQGYITNVWFRQSREETDKDKDFIVYYGYGPNLSHVPVKGYGKAKEMLEFFTGLYEKDGGWGYIASADQRRDSS